MVSRKVALENVEEMIAVTDIPFYDSDEGNCEGEMRKEIEESFGRVW